MAMEIKLSFREVMIMDQDKSRAQILGENLERIRKEKGFSRKLLANSLGVGVDLIGLYENGKRLPPLDKIFNIATFLEVSVTDLISNNGCISETPNIDDIINKNIFEYRFKRAISITSVDDFFPTTELENGNIKVYIPHEVKRDDDGTLNFIGYGKFITFKDKKVFVECVEKAERTAIENHITFYQALKELVNNIIKN